MEPGVKHPPPNAQGAQRCQPGGGNASNERKNKHDAQDRHDTIHKTGEEGANETNLNDTLYNQVELEETRPMI